MVRRNIQRKPIKSPCVKMCKMNLDTLTCEGCGRTREHITNWVLYSDEQRDIIITQLNNQRNAAQ